MCQPTTHLPWLGKIKLGTSRHGVPSWWLLSVHPPGHGAQRECCVCAREDDAHLGNGCCWVS